MSEIIIKELIADESDLWDNIVDCSHHSILVHKYAWLKIIEKETKSQLHIYVGYLGNEIIAGIPLFYKKRFCYKCLMSPPGGAEIQNLGIIFPNYENLKQDKREYYFREFQNELDIYLSKTIKPDIISIITPPGLMDVRPYSWNGYSVSPRFNYIKDISDSSEVWNNFKKTLRKNILNAEKKD